MKNKNFRLVIFFTIVIALSVMLNSCGARKKNKSSTEESLQIEIKTKEQETFKEENNIKTDVEIHFNQETGTVTKTTKIKPIDNTKKGIVTDKQGKKTVLENAEIEETETIINTKTETNGKASTNSDTKKEAAKQREASQKAATKKAADNLHVERSAWSWWNVVYIIVAIYLIWRFGKSQWWEKIKEKIWFV